MDNASEALALGFERLGDGCLQVAHEVQSNRTAHSQDFSRFAAYQKLLDRTVRRLSQAQAELDVCIDAHGQPTQYRSSRNRTRPSRLDPSSANREHHARANKSTTPDRASTQRSTFPPPSPPISPAFSSSKTEETRTPPGARSTTSNHESTIENGSYGVIRDLTRLLSKLVGGTTQPMEVASHPPIADDGQLVATLLAEAVRELQKLNSQPREVPYRGSPAPSVASTSRQQDEDERSVAERELLADVLDNLSVRQTDSGFGGSVNDTESNHSLQVPPASYHGPTEPSQNDVLGARPDSARSHQPVPAGGILDPLMPPAPRRHVAAFTLKPKGPITDLHRWADVHVDLDRYKTQAALEEEIRARTKPTAGTGCVYKSAKLKDVNGEKRKQIDKILKQHYDFDSGNGGNGTHWTVATLWLEINTKQKRGVEPRVWTMRVVIERMQDAILEGS